jgi:hypothetical protein
MPQTSDERRARWPGKDSEALSFLYSQGYEMTREWEWIPPKREPTEREIDAIDYLVEEWDYGGIKQ